MGKNWPSILPTYPSWQGQVVSNTRTQKEVERRIAEIVRRRDGRFIEGMRVEYALPIVADLLEKMDALLTPNACLGGPRSSGTTEPNSPCTCGSAAINYHIHADWCQAPKGGGEQATAPATPPAPLLPSAGAFIDRRPVTGKQVNRLHALAKASNYKTNEILSMLLNWYGLSAPSGLNRTDYEKFCNYLIANPKPKV